jgi:MFS family permease
VDRARADTQQGLWTRSFVIITTEYFLVAIAFWLMMPVVSRFAADEFDASKGLVGFCTSIFVIGAIIARPLCGKWIHRVGQTRTFALGMGLCLLISMAYFAARSVELLLLIRFLHGAAWGITHVATGTIAAGVIPRKRYGEGLGYFTMSQLVAGGIGPFIGLLLIQHSSFDSVIIACAVASAVGLLIVPLLSVKDVELTADQVQETKGFSLSSYLQRDAVPIALVALVIYLCYASIVSFLALYTEEIRLIGAATFFFMVGAVVMFVTRPFVGRWFDARGENSVMYLGIPCFALGIVLLSQACSGWMLLLSAAVMSLGFGATQSSGLATVVRIAPEHRAGLANSTFYVFADMGAGIGPLLCGLLAGVAGYRTMYVIVAAIAAAGLVLYYSVHGRRAARR